METGDLLEELRKDGQVESTGRFTLDAAKAREKMKRYQLQDPCEYVLQVVRSAVAAGARTVDVRVDADDCRVRHDGAPPGLDDLQGLFNSLFRADRDAAGRSLRELAIGLNSALALDPAGIRLDAWNGLAGWTLFVAASSERVEPLPACPWPGGLAGVALHVRQRRSWRVVGRFLRGLVALHPEARAVHDRCRWCPVEVRVNGQVVNGEPDLGPSLLRREILGPDYRAVLVLPPEPESASRLELVLDGVRVEGKTVKLGPLEVRAVVWASGLNRNVSQSEVVEDATWKAFLVRLRADLRALLAELASQPDPPPGLASHLLRAMVRQELRAGEGWRRWRELKQALLEPSLFPVAHGGTTNLRCLLEQYDRLGALPFVRAPGLAPPEGWDRLVPVMEGGFEAVLQSIFPIRKDDTLPIQKAHARAARLQEWQRQAPREPGFVLGDFLVRVPLVVPEGSHPSLRGELALPADSQTSERPPLLLFRDSRPLLSTPLRPPGPEARAALWPEVAAAVNHDGLEPDAEWKAPVPGPALEECRAAVEATLPALFRALAERLPRSDGRAARARRAFVAWLTLLASEGATFEGSRPLPPGLDEVPLFRTVQGGFASLRDLAGDVQAFEAVALLMPGQPPPDPVPARRVLQPDPVEFRALETWLSPLRLFDFRAELVRLEQEARFLARPVEEARIPDPVLARLGLEGPGGLVGEVAVPAEAPLPTVNLRVLNRGRLVTRKALEDLPGPVECVVEAPSLRLTADWRDVVPGPAWNQVLELVRARVRELPDVLLPRILELDAGRRPAALQALWRHLGWEAGPSCDGFYGGLDARRRALARLACFPTAEGRWCSLQDLLAWAHEHEGKVDYVGPDTPAPVEPGTLLLRLTPPEASLVRGIVGTYRLRDATSEWRARAAARAFEAQPPVEAVRLPEGPWLATERLAASDLEGEVALAPEPARNSRFLLYHRRRFLGEAEVRLPVALVAAVDGPRLKPGAQGPLRDEAFQEVLEATLERARAMAVRFVRGGPAHPAWREQVLAMAGRLELPRPQAPGTDLETALLEVPLLPAHRGPLLALGELLERFGAERKLFYLPEGHGFPEEAAEAGAGGRPVPVLRRVEVELLSRFLYPLEDLSPSVAVRLQALQNRSRPRVETRLEACFPGVEWLARVPAGEGLEGEVGIPARRPDEPGLLFCLGGLPLARLDPHPGPGFLGVVDGPFEATPAWDGLARPEREALRTELALRRLVGALASAFPPADSPSFARAREVVLGWTDWRRALEAPLAGLEKVLAELPLFPLAGGRFADLATLGDQVRRQGRLVRCLPGEAPPAGDEVILLAERGAPEEAFLARLAPRGLADWSPPPLPAPAEPPPAVEPAAPAAEPAAPAVEPPAPTRSSEEVLLGALRGELRLLRESGHPELSDELLESLRLDRTDDGLLWAWDASGRSLVLGREHPLVRHLLAGPAPPPARLYFLVSSFYSILNRARPEVADEHERTFHRRILQTLLGPGRVEANASSPCAPVPNLL